MYSKKGQNKITQKRYTLSVAFDSIPEEDREYAKVDVMRIMGFKSQVQLWRYSMGISTPSLAQANAVEEYFNETWGIKDVWKEVVPEVAQ